MPELKLAKLPDRTPVKITITVMPELHQALQQYAGAYRATYGESEPVAELIPFILESFLVNDRGFAKSRKNGLAEALSPSHPDPVRRGARAAAAPPSFANEEE